MVHKDVCILGEGAFGTAIAMLLAHNGYTVRLWCYDAAVAQVIKEKHVNERYFPGVTLSSRIEPTTNINQALTDVRWVFEAIPVKYLRSVLIQVKPYFQHNQVWVILSKGIEQDSLLLPSQIVDNVFTVPIQKAVVTGPSFAHEVAQKQITAVALSSTDHVIAHELHTVLANDYFHLYITPDIIGVQIGAALKNVIALGIGMLDGAQYGDNPKAFFFTKGLQEIAHISVMLGGHQETIYGLAGVGDLVLTSLGKSSRNLEIGRRLGKGEKLETIIQKIGSIPEGINTVVAFYQLLQKYSIQAPLCQGIYELIFGTQTIETVLKQLFNKS
jgi:glycerol-3-phosphate dehydrogenase (NAD(P)+)